MAGYRTCPHCGSATPNGQAKCKTCGKWSSAASAEDNWQLVRLKNVERHKKPRLRTGPWDYVFGGGLTRTSVNLLGGVPGAGKSTLLLHICDACSHDEQSAPIYIAAEESLPEIAERAERLGIRNANLGLVPALSGANVAKVLSSGITPELVIIDSLQGLVGRDDALQEQICKITKQHAVKLNCPILLISHVTKQEVLAGRMAIQHVVDGTFLLYLDNNDRVLTCAKNRNGPAFLESVFGMTAEGLKHMEDRKDI